MGQQSETAADIFGLTPKPRGEGVWAWIRYHLIYLRSTFFHYGYFCAQPGCSDTPEWVEGYGATGSYCALHSTPEAGQLRYQHLLDSEANR